MKPRLFRSAGVLFSALVTLSGCSEDSSMQGEGGHGGANSVPTDGGGAGDGGSSTPTDGGGAAGEGGTTPLGACGDDPSAAEPLVLGGEGALPLTIVIPKDAKKELVEAAEELRDDIKTATGTTLEILKDDGGPVSGNVISLGATVQAKAKGLSAANLPFDAFRIVRDGNDLFIFGQDELIDHWVNASFGTVNGVYTFLEGCLDVRWLMPGSLYRDVPPRTSFSIGAMDREVVPPLTKRAIKHLNPSSATRDAYAVWARQNRFHPDTNYTLGVHSFTRVERAVLRDSSGTPTSFAGEDFDWSELSCDDINTNRSLAEMKKGVAYLLSRKPDWFALLDKNDSEPRLPEDPNDPDSSQWTEFKLETTNGDLIEWYANLVVRRWECKSAKEQAEYQSLSPSDGTNFSQRPQSQALVAEPFAPDILSGWRNYTPLILKWYTDVAARVNQKKPEIKMSGMLYGYYAFPPPPGTDTKILREDYFLPVYVERSQRYSHLVDNTWELVERMADGWSGEFNKGATWGYPAMWLYDAPESGKAARFTKPPATSALLLPSAYELWDRLPKDHVKMGLEGFDYRANAAMAYAGMRNYVLSRLAWDPSLDAEAVRVEWTNRMYGKETGAVVRTIDDKLRQWFKEYDEKGSGKPVPPDTSRLVVLQKFYVAHLPEIEQLVREAKAKTRTAMEEQRFEPYLSNVILMRWRLDQAGLTQDIPASELYTDDDDIDAIFAVEDTNIVRYPGFPAGGSYPSTVVNKVEFAASGDATTKSPGFWRNSVVIAPRTDGEITIEVEQAEQGLFTVGYGIREVVNGGSNQRLMAPTLLHAGKTIKFQGKSDRFYVLDIGYSEGNLFKVHVQHARQGTATNFVNESGLKTLTLTGPSSADVLVYHDPKLTDDFKVSDDATHGRVTISY